MNNELRALLIQALQEETCGVPATTTTNVVAPVTATTAQGILNDGAGGGGISPAVETPSQKASTNYWPLVGLAALSYLFLTDGK